MLWVYAGSTARFEQSFRDIADYVEIPGRQDAKANVFRLVYDWLRGGRSGRWLLILDNVDSPELLSEARNAGQGGQGTSMDGEQRQPVTAYLPRSQNGSILITSRSQAVALTLVEAKDIVAVQPMAPAQALALFEKKLGPLGQSDNSRELAAALEFMPLAIVQAAAYISQRAPRYSIGQYLEDFRKSNRKRTSLLNYEGGQLRRDWQAHNSILITWQISFEHIQGHRPSAADLLSLMSFFDRQGIPEALVQNRAEIGNGHERQEELDECSDREEEEGDNNDDISGYNEDDGLEDDVQTLRNYSFVSVDTDRTFKMHALVQLATRKWLDANGQLEAWKQRYIKNLSAEFPTGEYENWTYCQTLFPHAKSALAQRPKGERSLREWASLLYNAAWYAWKKGNITEAVNLSEIVMEVRKKILGEEDKETLSSMGMAGRAYSLGGRWKEAEELQVRTMKITKKVLGEEHPNTLASIANLTSIYRYQGRWKEAEELDVQVIEIRKRVLGEEHADTLTSMANLASTYGDQGRWKEAESLGVQVKKARIRVLGKEHPDTLTSMAGLTWMYYKQGKLEEAQELGLFVKEKRIAVLTEEHRDTLTSMAHLGAVFEQRGRSKEAENWKERVLETRVRVLGGEHPDTLISMVNLALTYRHLSKFDKAEDLEIKALKIRERTLGFDHPSTLTSMNNLAWTWRNQGRHAEAISLMERCISISIRKLGRNHPSTQERLRYWSIEPREANNSRTLIG